MPKVSVIIPSKDDRFLARTIKNIQTQATGDIEIIVVLDGPTSHPLPKPTKKLIYITKKNSEGLRKAINDAANKARGEYLLRTDAHCMFGKGYDEILQKDCKDNWVVIPRRYGMSSRTPDLWKRQMGAIYDYYYLTCPWTDKLGVHFNTQRWLERTKKNYDIPVDETMSIHGSVWFMPKKYFFQSLERLDTENFGKWGENEEIILKTWLGGGSVMVNKKTWYAHLQMRADRNTQAQKDFEAVDSHKKIAEYWTTNRWEGQIHEFDWLIDKFWPLPTTNKHDVKDEYWWPENWRDYYEKQNQVNLLSELAFKYRSDKCPQIKHHFTEFYYELFKDKKLTIKKVVEIGVQTGASLRMWRDFFPKATIFGADINKDCLFEEDGIKTFLCDQTKAADLKKLIKKIGKDIDIFIEDGSHNPDVQVFTCLTVMPLLSKKALYVIEDVGHKEIAAKLSMYNCEFKRKSKMTYVDDRLLLVRNV